MVKTPMAQIISALSPENPREMRCIAIGVLLPFSVQCAAATPASMRMIVTDPIGQVTTPPLRMILLYERIVATNQKCGDTQHPKPIVDDGKCSESPPPAE